MPYHALSTPATLEKTGASAGSFRRFPDHAYSPLFTTGILNSAHPVEHGRSSQHLTFRQEAQSTPRKHAAKSGLPSPLSASITSPSIKKKQSSTSLARSLASSQSGSINTPKKGSSVDRDAKGSIKPKSEWWRGRSSSYVGGKEVVKEDKLQGARTGWLRQSDVWMTSEGMNSERVANARTDGLPALPTYRVLSALPLFQENVPPRQPDNPVIKKKSSLGAFRFKNFFQSGKAKESGSRAEASKVQPFPLSPTLRANQPTQRIVDPHSNTRAYSSSYQSTIRPPSQLHSARSDSRPRPPLITTSTARFSNYPSPYSTDPSLYSPHNTLPYMSGAGDGWNTPFPMRSDLVSPPPTEITGFPFPAASARRANHEAMEQLAVPGDAGRHERVPSAAFEYQEFETSLRNSGQLSSIHGSGENVGESDKENDTRYLAIKSPMKSQSYRVDNVDQHSGSQRRSSHLRPQQSLDHLRRTPLVETVKPLSIGQNYPRGRPFALTDTNRQKARQQLEYGVKGVEASNISPRAAHDDGQRTVGRDRDIWNITPEFADLEVDSLGDAAPDFYDARW